MQHLQVEKATKPAPQSEKPTFTNQQPTIPSPFSLIQRAQQDPHNLTAPEILRLQQTIGNRAVSKLLVPNPTSNLSKEPAQVQRVYTVTSDPDEVLADVGSYVGRDLDWKSKLDEIYAYIVELRKVLEDDSDVSELEEWEKGVDKLAKEADELTKEFDKAPAFESGRSRRDSTASQTDVSLASSSRKRKGTDTLKGEPATKKVREQTKQEISWNINGKSIELGKTLKLLKQTFPLSEGGFSAKGRAHDMDEKEKAEMGYDKVTTWFNDIMLDGKVLNKVKKVYKQNEKNADPAGNPALYFHSSVDTVEKLITPLTPTHGPFSFERPPSAKDRGAGQLAAMAGVNATGYAKLAKVPGWKNSRWEWLHIRAASLGGTTDGSNLVAGTRDANTHMMPFEANIRLLAKIVNEDTQQRYKALKVTFKATGQDPKAKHRVEEISISWELVKDSKAASSVKGAKGEAKFKPLQTDASISKTEVAILEQTLKQKREEIG